MRSAVENHLNFLKNGRKFVKIGKWTFVKTRVQKSPDFAANRWYTNV